MNVGRITQLTRFKMHTPVFPSDSAARHRAAAELDKQNHIKAIAPHTYDLLIRIVEAADAGDASLTDALYEEARELVR